MAKRELARGDPSKPRVNDTFARGLSRHPAREGIAFPTAAVHGYAAV